MVLHHRPLLVVEGDEVVEADVAEEVDVDHRLEHEHGPLRGGVEAEAVGRDEDLVQDEQEPDEDPGQEPRVVRVHQRSSRPKAAPDLNVLYP